MNKYQNFYIETTLEQLDQQFKNVNAELEEIYKKYSKQHDILIQELSKIMMEYTVKAEYMELSKKEQIEVNKKLQMSIYDMVNEEKNNDTESIKNILGDAIANTYNYQEYVLALGIDFTSLPLTEEVITKIINNKIAGEIWSNRLWTNKKDLEILLKKDVDDFIKGKLSLNKIGQNIRSSFDTDYYKSQRLVRTELARVQGEILDQFDKDHEVEWQMWMSTLDNRTSSVCKKLDGKKYRIDDKNKPTVPAHIMCRSALVGIPNSKYSPTTRRDNETGEIIPYTTYNEWLKKQNK